MLPLPLVTWGSLLVPTLSLILLPWLLYWDILKEGTWVSDDILGIAVYDGRLQKPWWDFGHLFRKLRYEVGKVPNPNRDWKAAGQPPFLSSPEKHHRLSFTIASGTFCALYALLHLVTTPEIAYKACLLFLLHPLSTQTIGWISGIGYITGAFFMALGIGFAALATATGWLTTPLGVMAALALYGLIQIIAIEAQFTAVGAALVLAYLGYWPFAVFAGLLAVLGCLHTFFQAVRLRTQTFKEQQMEQSTKLYCRKAVTVLKTLYYYMRLAVFPKRLGLYHTFGYHYELPYIEYEDKYFFHGLGILAALTAGVLWGPPPIRFAVIWWTAFIILFLNWITAHQFVSERYVWLPSLAVCFLAATYLPSWAFWLLAGMAAARSWCHIPTYYNETQFYQSNLWNFPTCEVALGNLGVVYQNRGLIASAMDSWALGTRVNEAYDVNWYNLASSLRTRGPVNPNYFSTLLSILPQPVVAEAYQRPEVSHLYLARYCLQRAISGRTCHFPQPWIQELAHLERALRMPGALPLPRLVHVLRMPA